MGRSVHSDQPLFAHVSVDLRRLQARVAEELLDNSQVRATVEQMGGEAVAQGMRVCGYRRPAVDYPSHVSWAQADSRPVEEHGTRPTIGPGNDPPAISQP